MNIKRSCPYWTEKPRDTTAPRYNDHFIIQNCGVCIEYNQENLDRCNAYNKLLEYVNGDNAKWIP